MAVRASVDGVQASEALQFFIAQRLHADRHAIDASGAITGKAVGFDAVGIGFERDFGAGLDGPEFADVIEDGSDGCRLHERGRATSEEDRIDVLPSNARLHFIKFAQIGSEEAGLVPTAEPNVAVEVAVRAFLRAERPVNVNAEQRICVGPLRDDAHGCFASVAASKALASVRQRGSSVFSPTEVFEGDHERADVDARLATSFEIGAQVFHECLQFLTRGDVGGCRVQAIDVAIGIWL